jgi:hypothetical protein
MIFGLIFLSLPAAFLVTMMTGGSSIGVATFFSVCPVAIVGAGYEK